MGPINKKGPLQKYTNVLKGYQPRYFVLENGLLSYYKEVSNTFIPRESRKTHKIGEKHYILRGQINVQSCEIVAHIDDDPFDIFTLPSTRSATSSHIPIGSDLDKDKDKDKEKEKEKEKERFGFTIDVGTEIIHLRAKSDEERDSWVRAVKESKDYYEALIVQAGARSLTPAAFKKMMTQFKPPFDRKGSVGSVDSQSQQPLQTQERQSSSGTLDSTNVSRLGSTVTINEYDPVFAEDDGLQESVHAQESLVMDLKRIEALLNADKNKVKLQNKGSANQNDLLAILGQCFPNSDGKTASAQDTLVPDVYKGLTNLVELSLYVIQNAESVMIRKIKIEQARMQHEIAKREEAIENMSTTSQLQQQKKQKEKSKSHVTSSIHTTAGASEQQQQPDSSNYSDLIKFDEFEVEESSEDEFYDAVSRLNIAERRTSTNMASADSGAMNLGAELKRIETSRIVPPGHVMVRTKIPPPKEKIKKPSVWSVMKDSVGKDLSRISVPVVFNEPIDFLQRMAEDVEYSELLDKAATCKSIEERILYVSVFAVSHYGSTQDRLGKPFNPMLGETYEYVNPNKGNGLRIVCEQVSHHPPVSVAYVEGGKNLWSYKSAIEVKNKFWGKSLEVFPTGWNHVKFPSLGEHYTFEQPTTCVHNVLVGTLWIDNYGDVIVREHISGISCRVTLQRSGWRADSKHYAFLSAQVVDKDGKQLDGRIEGYWNKEIFITHNQETVKAWQVNQRPPKDHSAGYNFTAWAINLNAEIPNNMKADFAPTDARFRPDQRCLEQGFYEKANTEKLRVEELQRSARKEREAKGEKYEPCWFEKKFDPITQTEDWEFNGKYFDCKVKRDWSRCPILW